MKKNINIKICIYILLFIIVPVTCIDAINPGMFDKLQFISVAFMLICIVMEFIKKREFDKFDLIMFLNAGALVFSSVIKHTMDWKIAFSIVSLFAIPVFIKNSMGKATNALQALYYVYTTIIILNFITIFYRIEIKSQEYFFIGGKNAISLTIVPAMLIVSLYSKMRYNKLTLWNIVMLALCMICLFISNSSTAIVVAAIILINFTILKGINISGATYSIMYITIFIMIVFGTSIMENTFINTIIKETFNKDLTFTNRTVLWEISYENFLESPLIGYGKNNDIIYTNTSGKLDQSHNMILQLLLAGGIISLGLFFAIIYITNKKIKDNNQENINHIILFYFFIYAIVGLTESIVFNNQLWMMLAIGYSINKTCENYEKVFKEEKEENYDKEIIIQNKKIYK